jgi:Chaperone of endosialidase
MKTTICVSVAFLCLAAFGPKAKPVNPPPDGGYPGGNTAEGQNALFSLTSGGFNTAVGWLSLKTLTTGQFNTAVGAGTLFGNTADNNTAIGAGALLSNTIGDGNTANGAFALFFNTAGGANTATGFQALLHNSGDSNTATGAFALSNNTMGGFNTATGDSSLGSNTSGARNTGIGQGALTNNQTGDSNTAVGPSALVFSSGSNNIALGDSAGSNVVTTDNNICIGSPGADVGNSCFIGQIYSNVQPIVGTDPDSVTITSGGRLGRGNVSSRRYKHDIKPMDKVSEVLYALKPVSFRYNKDYDATQTLAFGLIAEDVAEVYPDLVGRDREGQPESVRYEQINAMLLNEFLKEHKAFLEEQRTVEKLEAIVSRQQEQIEALAVGLEKVTNQIELSRSAPQTVVNNP